MRRLWRQSQMQKKVGPRARVWTQQHFGVYAPVGKGFFAGLAFVIERLQFSMIEVKEALHNSSRNRVVRIGMGCKAVFAANIEKICKKTNAADRPRPSYHEP